MKQYRAIVNLFKRRFPEYRVAVRRIKMSKGLFGDCRYNAKTKTYNIRINNKLDEETAIDTFVHEFAHVLAWNEPGDWHGMAWGRAYSKCYRFFLKEWVES